MAKVTIEFATDNAAFEDLESEIPHIFAHAQTQVMMMLEGDGSRGTLRDSNGNTVGKVTVE